MNHKQELQKLVDNIDFSKLCIKHDEENTHFDDIVYSLEQCQKEPTLHDKLIKLCKDNNAIFYKYYFQKKDYSDFRIYLDIPVVGHEHFDIIIYHKDINDKISVVLKHTFNVDPESTWETTDEILNGLLCVTHENVFDAIKLFEKWSQEC